MFHYQFATSNLKRLDLPTNDDNNFKTNNKKDFDYLDISNRLKSFERIIVGRTNAPTFAQKQFRQSVRRFSD